MAGRVVAWGGGYNTYGQTNVPASATNVVAIAAGFHHSLALRADGTVVAWGWNDYSQTNVPAGLSSVVAIACGGVHSLALRADGSVVAWGGYSSAGQWEVPLGLSNVVAIVGGRDYSLALRKDGVVVGWGGPYKETPGVVASTGSVVAMAVSLGYESPLISACADGTLRGLPALYCDSHETAECWTNIVAVAGGFSHVWFSLALRADGTVQVLGGWHEAEHPHALTNAIAVATGADSNLTLKSDGTVAAWGYGSETKVPPGLSNVVAIAAGEQHSLALVGQGPPVLPVPLARRTVGTSANAVFHAQATGEWPLSYQWQFNGTDLPGATGPSLVLTNVQPKQAGLYSLRVSNARGTITNEGAELVVLPVMIRVPPAPQVSYPGGSAKFAVRAVGNEPLAYQWRFNGADLPGATNETLSLSNLQFSQIGEYSVVVSNPWGSVRSDAARLDLSMVVAWDCDTFEGVASGLTNIVAVAAGEEDCAILLADGTRSAWGDNSRPTVGSGDTVAVAVGDGFGLTLGAHGGVDGWGENYDVEDYPIPPGLSNVVAIDAGEIGLALRVDGTVAAWGEYHSSIFDVDYAKAPAWLSNVVQVAAGSYYRMSGSCNLALRADGTVVPFGNDGSRQGTRVEGLSNIVAIAAGNSHGLALRADGIVITWATMAGKTPSEVPAGLSNVVAVAAEDQSSLALRSDGTVVGWGFWDCEEIEESGLPLTVPPGLSNVVAIAAGSDNLALIGHGPPVLRPWLARRVVRLGANAFFYAPASGETPLQYQWQFQGTNLPGAHQPFLVLTNVGLTQQGRYSLTVSNRWGVTTGANADLTVLPVTIRVPPTPQVSYPGGSAEFTVRAVGNEPLTYQWRLNGTELPDATNDTLRLDHLQFSQIGEYSVVVSNPWGSVVSDAVRLDVSMVVAWDCDTSWGVSAGLTNIVGIAAGEEHSVLLRADGTLVIEGCNGKRPMVEPANVLAVAAAEDFGLALTAEGKVLGWGDDYNLDDYPIPPGLSNVVAIAAGQVGLGVRSDGTVAAWGEYHPTVSNIDFARAPAGLSNVVEVAAGIAHGSIGPGNLALRANGTVVPFGNDGSSPGTIVEGLSNVVAISVGYHAGLALRGDGTVAIWATQSEEPVAEVPAGLSNVVAIAAGDAQHLALQADGTLVAWGSDECSDTEGRITVPQGLRNVVAIGAGWPNLALIGHGPPVLRPVLAHRVVGRGANAVFYALAAGEMPLHYQWQFQGTKLEGANQPFLVLTNVGLAQQGHYSLTVSNRWGSITGANADLTVYPVLITAQPVSQTTWLGQTATLEVEAQGAAPLSYQWRYNGVDLPGATNRTLKLSRLQSSQSGDYSVVVANALGSVTSVAVWLEVSAVVPWGYSFFGASNLPRGLSNVAAVAAGRDHCLALRDDGTVVQWGLLNQDQVPVGLADVVAIAAGELCSFAVRSNGTVAAWGSYYEGGTFVPVRLPLGLTNVVAIAAGGSYVLALRKDGTVIEWDYNGRVRTGVPAGLNRVIAIAAGWNHSLALRSDGKVVAWGNNAAGQTDVPPDLNNVAAIAAANDDNLALRADGTVVAWGRNLLGCLDVPMGLTDVVAIAIAGSHSLALRADGSVVAWGQYYDGSGMIPMAVPPGLSNVVAIAAAEGYSLAAVRLRPVLEILRRDSDTLLLQWDSSAADWLLQESARLESGSWVNVTNTPANDGTRVSVSIQVLEGARFFRLRSRGHGSDSQARGER